MNEREPMITTLVYRLYGDRRVEQFKDNATLDMTRESARLLVDLWDHCDCKVVSIKLPTGVALHGYAEIKRWIEEQ